MSSNTSSSVTAAALQTVRDSYMEKFSTLFERELVEVYETDASADAVKQLRQCIEAGVAVFGHPLVVGDHSQ